LADPIDVSVSNGTLEDESKLPLFIIHLGLEHASSDDDESPWIEPPNMAYPSLFGASLKSNACIICATSGLVRLTVK
jgi:hypothetical protein